MRTLLLMILCVITVSYCEDDYTDLDINELFPSFNAPDQDDNLPVGTYSNITIDVEKLDIKKFKKKIEQDLKTKIKVKDDLLKEDPRRAILLYMYDDGTLIYGKGSEIASKQKAVDLILQMVYMSRRVLKQLENDKYFNRKDTGFRIGYLYNKLRKILTKMVDYLNIMHKHNFLWNSIINHIHLHQKVLRLHIDFQYFYWVMVQLDGTYRESRGKKFRPKMPKANIKFGGISREVVIGTLPKMTFSQEHSHDGPWNLES